MAGSFRVSWIPEKTRMEIMVEGQFDVGLMRRYAAAVRAAMANAPASGWILVSDVSNLPPQPPEVQQILNEIIQEVARRGCLKTAMIASKTVTEMQINRLLRSLKQEELANFFGSRAEAEASLANVRA